MSHTDYTRTGQSTLTFPNNGSQIILVGIDNDVEDEEAEMFSISLGNAQPPGDVIISPDQITITITDDDEPPTPTGIHQHSFPHYYSLLIPNQLEVCGKDPQVYYDREWVCGEWLLLIESGG